MYCSLWRTDKSVGECRGIIHPLNKSTRQEKKSIRKKIQIGIRKKSGFYHILVVISFTNKLSIYKSNTQIYQDCFSNSELRDVSKRACENLIRYGHNHCQVITNFQICCCYTMEFLLWYILLKNKAFLNLSSSTGCNNTLGDDNVTITFQLEFLFQVFYFDEPVSILICSCKACHVNAHGNYCFNETVILFCYYFIWRRTSIWNVWKRPRTV